jgi:hypothetical protein
MNHREIEGMDFDNCQALLRDVEVEFRCDGVNLITNLRG